MSVSKPQPWQIWWLRQNNSRSKTEPKQPNDESKDKRMFLIIASWGNSLKVTACPIQTINTGRVGQTEVEIIYADYPSFLKSNSKIMCHEIVTVPVSSFESNSVGFLKSSDKDKVKISIKFYLKLT